MPSIVSSLFMALLALAPEVSAIPQARELAKAVYFVTNTAPNSVGAVSVGFDGLLKHARLTPTGGNGLASTDAAGVPDPRDGLLSQSSVFILGDNLFTINSGSNTVSMFAIDKFDPTKLRLIGKPVAVPGEFPNAVAASAKNKLVCVSTTGAVAGVACAPFDPKCGIAAMDALRPFDLGQTTPPVGPLNTVTQPIWSQDESQLITLVKGDPTTNKTGFVSTFKIQKPATWKTPAVLSSKEVRTTPEGSAVLFGSLKIPGTNNIFATDAGFGAAILNVNAAGVSSTVAKQTIDGQKATCWVTISPKTNTAFVTDINFPRIVEMSTKDAKILSITDVSSVGTAGLIDLNAAGDFMYAVSPRLDGNSTKIVVAKVSTPGKPAKIVQTFELEKFGVTGILQGMALLK